MPSLTVQPRPFLYFLLAIVGGLTLLHAAALVLDHGFGFDYVMGFSAFVDLDNERNLPTFAAVLMLLFGAGLAAVNAAAAPAASAERAGWWTVAAAFLFVALDEHFSFHEPLGYHLHQRFDDLPLFAWVVPYGMGAALLGLVLLPWLARLDRPSRNGMLLAAGLFLGGAVGMELVSSQHIDGLDGGLQAAPTLTGELFATAEEVLELIGVTVFLYTLVKRLSGLRITPAGQPQAASATIRATSPA